jgi:choice-of-anchor A domain-containing protein
LCPGWETQCAGLDVVLAGATYSFRDFNVISFNDFNAETGDVEGRLAAGRDVNLGAGYSVGYELQTATNQPDRHLPYSLVVGRDLTWVSGALYPQGNGIPYPGLKEDMYVGRNLATSDDLAERRTGGPGDLSVEFTDGKTCYTGYSNTIAAKPDNVVKTIQWSGLSIDCNNPTGTDYYVSLTPAEMSQFTYTTTSQCNFQARWFINIRGSGDVTITGASFPAVPGGVVYNVIGARTVNVYGTSVDGGLLAPDANLNQTGGVIVGKVVANNVEMSLQINKQNTCPNPSTVQIPSIVTVPSVDSENVFTQGDALRVGDTAWVNYNPAMVIGFSGKDSAGNFKYTLNKKVSVSAGNLIIAKASSTDSRTQTTPATTPSSASAVTFAFALVVALIALAF